MLPVDPFRLVTGGRLTVLARQAGTWTASTPAGSFEPPVVVNAAGGWVQQVAALAGLPYRNVVPFPRTAGCSSRPPAATSAAGR